MNHYRRLPSIAVLVAFALAAILYARPWKAAGAAGGTSIEQLEQQIAAGQADVPTWLAYGQALFDAGQFARSALAYEKAIESEPYHRPARFQRGLALAKAGDREGLLDFLNAQLHQEPKLVAELLARPELGSHLADSRYSTLQKEAAAQAMD
jgi:tetratricopeptide (TPR) repeat protein